MTSATTYLSGSGAFDQAIADFAETYADQNERDYAASRPPSRTAEAKRPPRSNVDPARKAAV
jgi:hypothetical protein